MADRRKFLRQISLASAGSFFLQKTFAARAAGTKYTGNIVLSTWSHGLPANDKALELLENGERCVEAAQQGVMVVEADPTNLSVGLGGYPDRDGHVTLDACVMDENGMCGAVMALEHIEHPVAVARLVMDKTPHVQLAGEGALKFALDNGFEKKSGGLNDAQMKGWKEWLEKQQYKPIVNFENHDTIGLVCRDAAGNFGGACTTSGLAFKMHGRVGDSPIIGAGLFVDNEVGAATATGLGEAVVRISGSHTIVEAMRYGKNPQEACEVAVQRLVSKHKNYKDFQVGFLALSKEGEVGAYAIQKGFQYALARDGKNELLDADYYMK